MSKTNLCMVYAANAFSLIIFHLKDFMAKNQRLGPFVLYAMARTNGISINSWNPIGIVENMLMCEQDVHTTTRKIMHKNR